MIREGQRLADHLHRLVERKGWPLDSYRVFITANTNWPKWRVMIVSDLINEKNESELFNDVSDEIDRWRELGEVTWPVGLSLWRPDVYALFGHAQPSEGEIELPDELINPGAEDRRGPSRAHSR